MLAVFSLGNNSFLDLFCHRSLEHIYIQCASKCLSTYSLLILNLESNWSQAHWKLRILSWKKSSNADKIGPVSLFRVRFNREVESRPYRTFWTRNRARTTWSLSAWLVRSTAVHTKKQRSCSREDRTSASTEIITRENAQDGKCNNNPLLPKSNFKNTTIDIHMLTKHTKRHPRTKITPEAFLQTAYQDVNSN